MSTQIDNQEPVLRYKLIHLGDNCYDLIPEPTQIRFKSLEDAKKFWDNLTNQGTISVEGKTS
jgi:hypothetical protein